VRVVAGELRGRRIEAPPGTTTRPTTDRVREAVFNALGSRDIIEGRTVADLYAGSGALGFEALSRGAAHCTFVERDRTALASLRRNIDALALASRARVVAGDALAVAASIQADVVFADPPYDFVAWDRLLDAIRADVVVAEADAPVAATPGWTATRQRRYGRTWVTFLSRATSNE
jgi:16S rRNA (guanine966-N2)-methyltransferase